MDSTYIYDAVGNVTGIEDRTPKAPTSQTFTYDHRDRLTSVTGPTAADTDTYSYDAIGNLLTKGGQSYSYGANGNGTSAGPHQVRSKGGWAYTYDANGNLESHNGRTYTWNSDNLPSRILIPNSADERYTYDADGERLTRTVNGSTTVYLGGIWEQELQTGVTRSHYTLQDQVVAQRSSSPNEVLYLHNDHLGSVSAVTNASGFVVSKQDFTPWGEIRGGGSGITQTSLNFTGQRRDSSGLLYYHARYYDPNLGRFLSADSVVPGAPNGSLDGVALKPLTVDFHETGFATGIAQENGQGFWFQLGAEERQKAAPPWGPANAQALNRYSYVQNNPLNYIDPTGHDGIDVDANEKDFIGQTHLDRLIDYLDDLYNSFSLKGGAAAALLALGAQLTVVAGPIGALVAGLAGVAIGLVVLNISLDIYRVLSTLQKAKAFLDQHGGGRVSLRLGPDGRVAVKAYSKDGYFMGQYTRVVFGTYYILSRSMNRFSASDRPARLNSAGRRRSM